MNSIFTQQQDQYLNLLRSYDPETSRRMLDIPKETLKEWLKDLSFRIARRASEAEAREDTLWEVTGEMRQMLTLLRNLREHIPFKEQLEYLKEMMVILKESRLPFEWESSQLTRRDHEDAVKWRRYQQSLIEQQAKDEEEKREPDHNEEQDDEEDEHTDDEQEQHPAADQHDQPDPEQTEPAPDPQSPNPDPGPPTPEDEPDLGPYPAHYGPMAISKLKAARLARLEAARNPPPPDPPPPREEPAIALTSGRPCFPGREDSLFPRRRRLW